MVRFYGQLLSILFCLTIHQVLFSLRGQKHMRDDDNVERSQLIVLTKVHSHLQNTWKSAGFRCYCWPIAWLRRITSLFWLPIFLFYSAAFCVLIVFFCAGNLALNIGNRGRTPKTSLDRAKRLSSIVIFIALLATSSISERWIVGWSNFICWYIHFRGSWYLPSIQNELRALT